MSNPADRELAQLRARKIHKYYLRVEDRTLVVMPKGAEILHLGVQNNEPYIWALVDPVARPIERYFRIVTTGGPVHERIGSSKYIGTFMMYDGEFVGHVFYD